GAATGGSRPPLTEARFRGGLQPGEAPRKRERRELRRRRGKAVEAIGDLVGVHDRNVVTNVLAQLRPPAVAALLLGQVLQAGNELLVIEGQQVPLFRVLRVLQRLGNRQGRQRQQDGCGDQAR